MKIASERTSFIERLHRSELLTEVEIACFAEHVPFGASDIDIAKRLVNSQLLTPFQANCLLTGRSRGLKIAEYSILNGLSHGGIGEVYSARRSSHDELFAIKLLHPRLRQKIRARLRLQLEARALERICHRNVVELVEFGQLQHSKRSLCYLVTELIAGPNLHEFLAIRGRLPWQQVCDIMAQVSAGVRASHQAGIIHRDLKPANILLTSQGVAKVIDFGLAQFDSGIIKPQEDLLLSSSKVGTERFSAPEQLTDVARVEPAADVYGIGATLFYALTGQAPASPNDNTAEQALNILRRKCKAPLEIQQIVCRSLQRRPVDRPGLHEVIDCLRSHAIRFPITIEFDQLVKSRKLLRKRRANGGTSMLQPAKETTNQIGNSGTEPTATNSTCVTTELSASASTSVAVSAAEMQLAELSKAMQELNVQLAKAREDLAVADSQNCELRNRNEQLTEAIDSVRAEQQQSDVEFERLSEKYSQAIQEIQVAKQERERLRECEQFKDQQFRELRTDRERVAKSHAEQFLTAVTLRSALQDAHRDIEQLQAGSSAQKTVKSGLQSRIEADACAMKDMEQAQAVLQHRLRGLESRIQVYESRSVGACQQKNSLLRIMNSIVQKLQIIAQDESLVVDGAQVADAVSRIVATIQSEHDLVDIDFESIQFSKIAQSVSKPPSWIAQWDALLGQIADTSHFTGTLGYLES